MILTMFGYKIYVSGSRSPNGTPLYDIRECFIILKALVS
jgi:hypothetical protein